MQVCALLASALALVAFVGGFSAGSYHMGKQYGELKSQVEAAAQVHAVEVARLAEYGKGLEAELKKRQGQIRTVTKEIVREIPTVVGDGNCINNGWVRVHDAAVGVSVPARQPDDSTGGVTAARAAETVVVNYGECLAWREQLLAWQKWAGESNESQKRIKSILGAE